MPVRSTRPTRPAPPPSALSWWRPAVLVLAVVLTYANSLSGPFILDDQATVVQNAAIRDLTRPGDVLWPAQDSPVAGRPLASLSFALNYAVHGLDVTGYHVVNVALHALCALLLFVLVRWTCTGPRARARLATPPEDLACAAALLWAVHPLASEAVNYLSQRTESLMAACFLLAVYAAARAAGGERRWGALAVSAAVAGALAKESMAAIPVIVALYDRVWLYDSWREAWASRRRLYAGLALSWVVAGAVVAAGPRDAVVGFSTGVSPWTYLWNQAEIIVGYLRLAAWPDALVVFYGWPRPLTLGDVAPETALLGALVLLSAVALVRAPALGFLGAWFFITLAPASSVLPVATEVGAERRMYLPLMALAVLAVVGLDRLARLRVLAASRAARRAVPALVLGLAAALAVTTAARNREYASPLRLAETVVERRPTAVAHHILAEQLLNAGRDDEAIVHLRQAVAGGNSRAGYLLGRLLHRRGELDAAIAQLEAFLATSELPYRLVPRWLEPPITEVVPARFALAQARAATGEWEAARDGARRILAQVPGHVGARRLLADGLFTHQQWADASAAYEEYLTRQPGDAQALMNLGISRVAVGDFDAAIAAFDRAAALEPDNPRPRQLKQYAETDRQAGSAER